MDSRQLTRTLATIPFLVIALVIAGCEVRQQAGPGSSPTSEQITTAQALGALSTLRLASLGGLLGKAGIDFTAEQLLIQSFCLQPGHLQARIGAEMDPIHRDSYRATLLRDSLGIPNP